MSFSSLPAANPNTWIEDYYTVKQLEATDAWFNPAIDWSRGPDGQQVRPQTVYVGTQHNKPTWELPVYDVSRHKKAWEAFRQGRYNKDQAEYKAWLQPEWEEAAKVRADSIKYGREYAKEMIKSAAGGVITSIDSPAIAVVQLLGEIMGRDEREYVLEDAVRRVATPNLTLSIDSWKGFTASANVGEGVEALVKKGEFSRDQYFLSKDVAHIMATDESSMTSDRDVFNTHVEHAVHDLRRIKNQKIATELATATDVSGGDFGATTNGLSTTDPVYVIGTTADVITANGGRPNRIVSAGAPFREFSSNTRITGQLAGAQDIRFGSSVVNNIAGLPQFTWYIDELASTTSLYVFDQNAVLLMQGPVRTAQYRIEPKGMDAYITRDYNLIKIVDATRAREITGVVVP